MKIETKFDLGQMVWVFHKMELVRKEVIEIAVSEHDLLGSQHQRCLYTFNAGCTATFDRYESEVYSSAEEAGAQIAKEAIERMKNEDES